MSRFARIRRRPDHWGSPHDRARARAAERLDGPLGLAESTWLDEHLAACEACAAIASTYETDRVALRGLRATTPEPPRDLWARTAAAIEQESSAHGRTEPGTGARRGTRVPVGALSGIAVVAVVVGVSAMSSGLLDRTETPGPVTGLASTTPERTADPSAGGTASQPVTMPTPFSVGAGQVQWVGTAADGSTAYNAASVRTVCRVESAADCATIDNGAGERLALTSTPKSIIGSPTEGQAIVVSDDGSGGQQILVLTLPEPRETPAPTTSPGPTTSATPTEPGSSDPPTTPDPATEPPATESPAPPSPTTDPTDPQATPSIEPSDPVPASPDLSPEPTVAANLAIASDIAVVGESAAFSADGTWFAFTAQPIDGSTGPDVYVWHIGDETARQLTTDGSTHFASWDGGEVVASRPGVVTDDGTAEPVTVVIDPATGAERPAGDLWRPVVDPTSGRVVGWAGTVAAPTDGTAVKPATGRLELRPWSSGEELPAGTLPPQIVSDGSVADFDVRWDETGTWFATWVADPSGTDVGRLSLYRVDPTTGLLERPEGAPESVPALPGFSIGEGRLAWATPPGQGGEGSRVQIVAWAPDGVGTVETSPGEDLIVVR